MQQHCQDWPMKIPQPLVEVRACWLHCLCLNCNKIQDKGCSYTQLFELFSSRWEGNSPHRGEQPLAIKCSASRHKDGNYTSAEGRWPHPSPHPYLPWHTGFTGWVTPQRFRLNGRTLNIQLFTHAIVSHPLFPDFLTPVCVPCPDTSAHDKHKALLPVITLRTCTSVSQQRLCARRLDENLLPRSQPLWSRMKSSHLQVKWTKIRPSIRKVG